MVEVRLSSKTPQRRLRPVVHACVFVLVVVASVVAALSAALVCGGSLPVLGLPPTNSWRERDDAQAGGSDIEGIPRGIALLLKGLRPEASEAGSNTFERARFASTKKQLNDAVQCMARTCGALLEVCGQEKGCGKSMLVRLRRHHSCGIDLTDDEEEDGASRGPRFLKELLRCHARHCPIELPLYEVHKGLLSVDEVQRIVALKDAAIAEGHAAGIDKKEVQKFRSFGTYGKEWEELSLDELRMMGVGHFVTYLHRVFERDASDILERLQSAANSADESASWGIGAAVLGSDTGAVQKPQLRRALKLRSAEFIEYTSAAAAASGIAADGAIGIHVDGSSLLTVSVALQDDDEFEGGALSMFSTCKNASVVPRRHAGDVSIWPSWHWHSAAPVTVGHRRILVVEFWEFCSGPRRRTEGYPTEEEYPESNCTFGDGDIAAMPVAFTWRKRIRKVLRPLAAACVMPAILVVLVLSLDACAGDSKSKQAIVGGGPLGDFGKEGPKQVARQSSGAVSEPSERRAVATERLEADSLRQRHRAA